MTKNRIIAIALLIGFIPSMLAAAYVYVRGMLSIREAYGDLLFLGSSGAAVIVAVAVGYLIDANRRRLQNLRDGKPEWQGLE